MFIPIRIPQLPRMLHPRLAAPLAGCYESLAFSDLDIRASFGFRTSDFAFPPCCSLHLFPHSAQAADDTDAPTVPEPALRLIHTKHYDIHTDLDPAWSPTCRSGWT